MPAPYFENFPLVKYSNSYAVNITARVAFTEESLRSSFSYYPYELKFDTRADLLSHYYYNDSTADWIIYYTNKVVDPYYGWYTTDENLNNLIEKKYGSLESAVNKIDHWEVNWLGDDTIISPSQYNSLVVNASTGVNQKKYWMPIFSEADIVIGYKRKPLDTTVKFNAQVAYNVTYSSNTVHTKDERVVQTSGALVTASGFVQFANTSTLILTNTSGSFSNTLPLVGESSNVSATYTTSNTINRSFPSQEAIYWKSVSSYENEIKLNEEKRSIYIIDKRYISDVQSTFENLMSDG